MAEELYFRPAKHEILRNRRSKKDMLIAALIAIGDVDSYVYIVSKVIPIMFLAIFRMIVIVVRELPWTRKRIVFTVVTLLLILMSTVYRATAIEEPTYDKYAMADNGGGNRPHWKPYQATTNAPYSAFFSATWKRPFPPLKMRPKPKNNDAWKTKLDVKYLVRAYQMYREKDIAPKPTREIVENKYFHDPTTRHPTMRVLLTEMDVPRVINKTPDKAELPPSLSRGDFAFLSIILGALILATILGNVFVIVAILIEKNLQTVANYLIVSLAVADLMVACMVMPLGALYEIHNGWILGPELCEVWTASDVLCCTASILHLVAIALDRFWSVTDIEYITKRSACRILTMITTIWIISLIVSITPQFGFKDPDYLDRINIHKRCMVSQDVGYQVFATCATFYIPLMAILILYWKIFQAARSRIHKHAFRSAAYRAATTSTAAAAAAAQEPPAASLSRPKRSFFAYFFGNRKTEVVEPSTSIPLTELPSSGSAIDSSQDKTAIGIDMTDEQLRQLQQQRQQQQQPNQPGKSRRTRRGAAGMIVRQIRKITSRRRTIKSLEARREKKAAQTLAIITGVFVVCWLPFFLMALVMSIFPEYQIHPYLASLFLWLGYFNSTLNPIIYTIFNPEFRKAFHRIITCINNLSVITSC